MFGAHVYGRLGSDPKSIERRIGKLMLLTLATGRIIPPPKEEK